jgi:hypothetical protein
VDVKLAFPTSRLEKGSNAVKVDGARA